ncbi:MAG: methyltransferase domain-containing protein, partial [Acidobacteria bacterium]|nr:methyltransferase domain-containing protein [Acidobacteriota bacterium]
PAPGAAAHAAFTAWHKQPAHQSLSWEAALDQYKTKLLATGLSPAEAEKALSLIASWDEGAFYDPVYTAAQPKHPTAPTPLLMEAVRERKPGRALDVAMGQGRNSLYLARLGWDVTGFDTSRAGIEQARKAATTAGLKFHAHLSAD